MLRSVAANLPHTTVWIIGSDGVPSWVDQTTVGVMEGVRNRNRYLSTTLHLQTACESSEISDPFLLFNDDFFCLRPMYGLELLHRGPLERSVDRFRHLRSRWGRGLQLTQDWLEDHLGSDAELLSYDLHVPILVWKEQMRQVLQVAWENPGIHKRTLYGNLVGLGGRPIADPKVTETLLDDLPEHGWLSSEERSFARVVLPILRDLFPAPSVYELDEIPSVPKRESRVPNEKRRAVLPKMSRDQISQDRARRAAQRREQMPVKRRIGR